MVPTPYASLGRRGQIARLRRLGRVALGRYGLEPEAMVPLRHEQNTTFRIETTGGGRSVLRINRFDVQTVETIQAEMEWLQALRRDTQLGVPEPVPARDGSLVVVVSDPGVPEPRPCVVLRWLDGRFIFDRLTPRHLRQLGLLLAALQAHGAAWTPPAHFVRSRVDTLTDAGRRATIAGSAQTAAAGEHPTRADGERALALVDDLISPAASDVVRSALGVVRSTTAELAAEPGAFGLIHADLHPENVLFHGGVARAIDFDDCGWGYHLYDLAVPTSEIHSRPHYPERRAALIEGYGRHRPLPDRLEIHLHAFLVLRGMQMLTWVLESREHPAFRDRWRDWARREMDWTARILDAGPTA